mmetsp:Transcript_5532/g.8924  ORF Transcript_5532/g.8924 Transcript_5532/m.8924 type:complete len:203 (-) Transcript_5532:1412-2020(-)
MPLFQQHLMVHGDQSDNQAHGGKATRQGQPKPDLRKHDAKKGRIARKPIRPRLQKRLRHTAIKAGPPMPTQGKMADQSQRKPKGQQPRTGQNHGRALPRWPKAKISIKPRVNHARQANAPDRDTKKTKDHVVPPGRTKPRARQHKLRPFARLQERDPDCIKHRDKRKKTSQINAESVRKSGWKIHKAVRVMSTPAKQRAGKV